MTLWQSRPGEQRSGHIHALLIMALIVSQVLSAGSHLSAIKESSEALNRTLRVLSERLVALTSNVSALDPASIASTADAMSKVLDALTRAKELAGERVL